MGRDKQNKRKLRVEEALNEDAELESVGGGRITPPARAPDTSADAIDSDVDMDDSVEVTSTRFADGIDSLSEKKAATRITGLQQILSSLRAGVDISEMIFKYQETATSSLLKLLRRVSSEREGVLACESVALLALVLGGDVLYNMFESSLQTLITRQEAEALRIAALKCYCFLAYPTSHAFDALAFTASILTMTSEGVYVTSALRGVAGTLWSFLSTSQEADVVLQLSREGVFAALSGLLSDTTSAATEVKIAAGECLAYLWEVADTHSPNLCAEASGELLIEDAEVVEATLAQLRSISNESSKRISKKDKKETKAAFKALLAWVIDGHAPSDMVRMSGADVMISSFERSLIVDMLRDVLQSGFQSSLRVYPIVRELLEVDEVTDYNDGSGECFRVDKNSALGKMRSANRRQERGYRTAAKNTFSHDEAVY